MDEYQYQIDLLKAMNQKLDSECGMYRALVDASGCAFLYCSCEEDICLTVGEWSRFFNVSVKNGNDLGKLFSEVRAEDAEAFREAVFVEESGAPHASCVLCKKDGRQWIACEAGVTRDADGKPKEKALCFRDITDFKRQSEDLAYLAHYDSLTGIYNGNRFLEETERLLRQASDEKTTVSVAFLNIDGFREINEGIGMSAGDQLLAQFGALLREICDDETTICAHLQADEFCLAVYDPFGERTVEALYRRIRERLERPFVLTEREVSVKVSAGVAEYPEGAETALELIERAQIMMLRAKRGGQSGICYFDAPIIQDFRQNAQIEKKLRNAVFEREFTLYYQPLYDMASETLAGVEALLRWRDGEGHMIAPGEFIPIAEKSSLIVDIGEWVIEKALSTFAQWKRAFGVSLTVSVNISAAHIGRDGFAHWLTQLVRQYGLSPKEIGLEITEQALAADFSRMGKKLEVLQHYGVRTAIDDFGTGCLPLSCLENLPIYAIKIDGSFIRSVSDGQNRNIIAESVVSMIGHLGYEAIAEGVERKEQLDYLREIGCRLMQGFLLGRPMSEGEIEELLEGQVWE